MSSTRLELLHGHEARWCRRANHWCRRHPVRRSFAAISRLGDGVFWYSLMGLLVLLDGMDGVRASAHMAATGVLALTLYKTLKRWTRRPRPYAADVRIRAWVAPLDEFSFPSGHTLHAVSFSIVALAYYPGWPRCWCRFLRAWRSRVWCWGCTIPATYSPPPRSALRWPVSRCGGCRFLPCSSDARLPDQGTPHHMQASSDPQPAMREALMHPGRSRTMAR